MPENLEFLIGQMTSTMTNVADKVDEMSGDIKTMLADNATTKERLANGAKHFAEIDEKIEAVELRKCPKHPWGKIGTILALGFTVLAILISMR